MLPRIGHQQAIQVIQNIACKTEDKVMYDQREKAERDYEWGLASARRKGEEIGEARGILAGQVQLLQRLNRVDDLRLIDC